MPYEVFGIGVVAVAGLVGVLVIGLVALVVTVVRKVVLRNKK